MPRTLLRALATTALVSATVLSFPAFAQQAAPAAAASNPMEVDPAKVSWGGAGIQTQWQDKSVKPGDDFDRFVSGKWSDAVVLPSDRTNWGSFTALRDLSEQRLHGIMNDLLASNPAPGLSLIHI